MKRRKPLKRHTPLHRTGPPKRQKRWKPKPHRLVRRTPLSPVGDRRRRDRDTGRVFGPLADLARSRGCQAADWCPGPCRGKIEAAHARSRGAGFGDWYVERTRYDDAASGEVVGNVFGACRRHHEYSDTHKGDCLEIMIRTARANGRDAIAEGIQPVL